MQMPCLIRDLINIHEFCMGLVSSCTACNLGLENQYQFQVFEKFKKYYETIIKSKIDYSLLREVLKFL